MSVAIELPASLTYNHIVALTAYVALIVIGYEEWKERILRKQR